jgi:nitronate monooxygenase
MGLEAGGHRGTFLTEDVFTQIGTLSVPEVVDSVKGPIVTAGGIVTGRAPAKKAEANRL